MTKLFIAVVAASASTAALANGFKCNNDHRANKPQWSVQVYNSAKSKPSTFIFATGKDIDAARTIARVEKNNRITLSGKGELGTNYAINLLGDEPENLQELGDQRLTSLDQVSRVHLWVDWDSGDADVAEGDVVYGHLDLLNKRGVVQYRYGMQCTYDKR